MTGVTTGIGNWNSDENYVQQAMESAMYASAHADDTLILVGPPRYNNNLGNMIATGVLQNLSISQGRQIVPHQAIGSARTFYQCSKASAQGNIGRLFVNGQNLLRALYTNLYDAQGNFSLEGVGPDQIASLLPHAKGNTNYVVNLDSRMFLIPFGMAIIFHDKLKNQIGGIYIELMVLPNWNTGITAGSPTLVEGTSFLADRVLPIHVPLGDASKALEANRAFNEAIGGDSALTDRLDEILGA